MNDDGFKAADKSLAVHKVRWVGPLFAGRVRKVIDDPSLRGLCSGSYRQSGGNSEEKEMGAVPSIEKKNKQQRTRRHHCNREMDCVQLIGNRYPCPHTLQVSRATATSQSCISVAGAPF